MPQNLVPSYDTKRIWNRLTAQASEWRKEVDARLIPVQIDGQVSSRIHRALAWIIIG
jgi:hypothetical protein